MYDPSTVANGCNMPTSFTSSPGYYADMFTFLPPTSDVNRETMWSNQSAMAACLCFTTELQTYSSGVLT